MHVSDELREQVTKKFGTLTAPQIIAILTNDAITDCSINSEGDLILKFDVANIQLVYALVRNFNQTATRDTGYLTQQEVTPEQITLRRIADRRRIILEPPPSRVLEAHTAKTRTLAQQRGELFRGEFDSYLYDFTFGTQDQSTQAKQSFLAILDKSIAIVAQFLAQATTSKSINTDDLAKLEQAIINQTGVKDPNNNFVYLFRPDEMGYCQPNVQDYYAYLRDLHTALIRRRDSLQAMPNEEFHAQAKEYKEERQRVAGVKSDLDKRAVANNEQYANLSANAKAVFEVYRLLEMAPLNADDFENEARFYALLSQDNRTFLQNTLLTGDDVQQAKYKLYLAHYVAMHLCCIMAKEQEQKLGHNAFAGCSYKFETALSYRPEAVDAALYQDAFAVYQTLEEHHAPAFEKLFNAQDEWGMFIFYQIMKCNPDDRKIILANLDRITDNIGEAISYVSLLAYLNANVEETGIPLLKPHTLS